MEIELLARKALDIIKTNWGLPDKGFIAGGSIANIMWELVSGNKAAVNDIDVFLFEGIISEFEAEEITKTGKKLSYADRDLKFLEDYQGLTFVTTPKEYYTIDSADKDGIFNYIRYRSSHSGSEIVLNSFDINCTTIGYSIEEDKFYWLEPFKQFLETGELKVLNLRTPAHTVMRLVKKQDELNAKVDQFEFDVLSFVIDTNFLDINKRRFSTRYKNMYEKYKDKLSDYTLSRDTNTEEFMKTKDIDIEIFTLSLSEKPLFLFESFSDKKFGGDKNIRSIYNTKHFLFYMRNIFKNERLKSIWEKTRFFFTNEEYIDTTIVDEKKLQLLSRVAEYAPNTIENMRGYKLSEQLDFIGKLYDKYKDDFLVGVSILEKHKMSDIDLNDDSGLLVLELSVRKNLVNDSYKTKVDRILERKSEYSKLDNLFEW